MRLSLGTTICEIGDEINVLCFPTTGAIAILAVGEDGRSTAVNLVGVEGVAGIVALYGSTISPWTMRVLLPGEGLRVTTDAFREHASRSRALEALLRR